MESELIALGCRKEGGFTLSSGKKSNIFWDIEVLKDAPYCKVVEVLRPFRRMIFSLCPTGVSGIPTGGELIADFVYPTKDLNICFLDTYVLVDDVLTTGKTIEEYIKYNMKPMAIAVLVNRSKITQIDGIPIISGFHADIVEC